MSTSHPTSTMKPSVEEFDVEGAPVPCGLPVFEASAQIRAGFIRKVYGILAVQLLFTVASSAFFMFHTATREWVLSDQTAYSFATIMPIPFLIGLYCHKDRHPLNMFLLGGFTLGMSYSVGVICAMYYASGLGAVVLQALVLTFAVFLSLSAYVLVSKKDFSFLGGGLFACLVLLIFWGLLNMFFDFGLGGRMIFSLIGSLVFIGYILYDTSLLVHHLGPDDYVIAAVTLYLDIVNLFLYLLELLRMLQGGNNQ